MCSIATSFLFSSFSFSPFNLRSLRSLSRLPLHIHSTSLLTLSSPLSAPFVFPFPPLATFFTVADIFRVWHAVKSLWRSMCAVWLSVLSHRMMERLAYLWYSSSCFTICLMYSRPLEYNQYSTGEQIAVKP